MVEEVGEGFAAFLGVLRGVGQFLEVLDAREGLGRGLVFQRADVAAAVVEELDKLGEGCGVAGLAEGFAVGLIAGGGRFICSRFGCKFIGVEVGGVRLLNLLCRCIPRLRVETWGTRIFAGKVGC